MNAIAVGANAPLPSVPTAAHERKHQMTLFAITAAPVAAAFVEAGLGGPFNGPITCPLRALTGIPCPFCNMTHSFVHLAGGHVARAFVDSPLGPLLFAFMAVAAVVLAVHVVQRRRWVMPRIRWAFPAVIALFGALWVYQLFNIGPLHG